MTVEEYDRRGSLIQLAEYFVRFDAGFGLPREEVSLGKVFKFFDDTQFLPKYHLEKELKILLDGTQRQFFGESLQLLKSKQTIATIEAIAQPKGKP